MKDDLQKTTEDSESKDYRRSLVVGDIVRFLSHLGNLYNEPRTGNRDLSFGLQKLANALKPYSQKGIDEIDDVVVHCFSLNKRVRETKKPIALLPPELDSLSEKAIDEILDDKNYTKQQLIELGMQRFGISHSKLLRLSKDGVIESVRAALNHERSLGVISEEARRGGEERSS